MEQRKGRKISVLSLQRGHGGLAQSQTMRPRLLSVISAVAAVILGTSLLAAIPPPRHVVMISVDGMKLSVYLQPGLSKVPTLRG